MNLLFSCILIYSASISFLCSTYVVKAFTTLELTTLVSRARQNKRYGQTTNLYYSNDRGNKFDGEDENILSEKIFGHANEDIGMEILALSASDKRRLLSIRSRSKVMPLMIIDTLLPKQSITFGSSDPKFSKLLDYLLGEKTSYGQNNNSDQNNNKIGIIGFNPFTESPLTFGVTAEVNAANILVKKNPRDSNDEIKLLVVEGKEQFSVQGTPWLDDSGSFYFADVEILDEKHEVMSFAEESESLKLYKEIPGLVDEFLANLVQVGQFKKSDIARKMKQLGPLPKKVRERALWVASLPIVNIDIRPAMLTCRNNFDRMKLSTAFLRSLTI